MRSDGEKGRGWTPSGRCVLVAVDIVAFGSRARNDHVLQHVRKALYDVLAESFSRCGSPLEECYVEDRGDGAIIVVPAGKPVAPLASSLIDWLRAGLRRYNEVSSEAARIRLRVALHTGDVHADEHGIVGAAVNHVFRLLEAPSLKEGLRESESTLGFIVSDQVYQDVLRHAPDLVDPNEFEQTEVRVKETVTTGWIRIPGGSAHSENSVVPPVSASRRLNSFVGRQAEVGKLHNLVRGARLVTLIGPGGSGKTRLARETLQALVEDGDEVCADGAHLIDLTGYQAGDDLCRALLTGLQLATRSSLGPPVSGPTADALVAVLRNQRILLVLDNCEQLLADAAAVAKTLLTRTSTVLLATSREALGVEGETTLPVGPLDLPPSSVDDPEVIVNFPAVRLFVDRARAADPAFDAAGSLRAIAHICRRLDGLPLPIELAAARVRALRPAQMAELLEDRFRLPGAGSGATPRHRTLDAVVGWSYDLLDAPAREAFTVLAIFRGGFRLREAQQLGVRLGVDPATMVELVVKLVDKSLLQASPVEDGAMRYRMLETLREYGVARLVPERAAELASHHAELYMELAEQQGTALHTGGQGAAIRTLERENDNLRAAFEYACRTERHEIALRLVDALGWYLWMRGERVFGWPGLVRALNITPDDQDPVRRARALNWTCHLGGVGITEPEARAHGEQARELLEKLGRTDSPEYCLSLLFGAFAYYRENNYAEGDAWISRSMELAGLLTDPWLRACSANVAGLSYSMRGEFELAVRTLGASVRSYREAGDGWGEHRARLWLSRTYESIGDLERALAEAEAARSLVCSLDLGEAEAPLNGWIARLHLCCGDEKTAAEQMAVIEQSPWWRSSPEAVAWMAECHGRQFEARAELADGDEREGLLLWAAASFGEAATGLLQVGLAVHAVSDRCRQAAMLARAGRCCEQVLRVAARDAAGQGDSWASELVARLAEELDVDLRADSTGLSGAGQRAVPVVRAGQ